MSESRHEDSALCQPRRNCQRCGATLPPGYVGLLFPYCPYFCVDRVIGGRRVGVGGVIKLAPARPQDPPRTRCPVAAGRCGVCVDSRELDEIKRVLTWRTGPFQFFAREAKHGHCEDRELELVAADTAELAWQHLLEGDTFARLARQLASLLVVVLVALLGACGDNAIAPQPRVELVPYPGAELAAASVDGARVWDELGFRAGAGGRACPRDWYETGDVDCTITIGVRYEPQLKERYGADGLADRYNREVIIDAKWLDPSRRETLVGLTAHELGHIVLDTGEHLPIGAGVMASGSVASRLTDADRELACRAIGVCL